MNIIYIDPEGTLSTVRSMFKDTFDFYGMEYKKQDFTHDNIYGISEQLIYNVDVCRKLSKKAVPSHLMFPGYQFDKKAVKYLNEIYNETKCNYVIFGDYAELTLGQLNNLFKSNGVKGTVIGKTPKMSLKNSFTKICLTGEEILSHMALTDATDKNNFVIITPDDKQIRPMYKNKCVRIDGRYGIDKQDTVLVNHSLDIEFSHIDLIYHLDDIRKSLGYKEKIVDNEQIPWV